ncbi:MAG TPA: DUF4432 family protein [Spirochaetia bacterium]|nr:DUF4432 family protein [Spirochaetia bacterium]
MTGKVYLERSVFTDRQRVLLEMGELQAKSLLFSTGVPGLRIENARGHIVMLPWQGQQVWDAVFDGRRLTMQTVFPEPVPTTHLLESYGAFLYHCGALRMGSPGPQDTHPLHGELPTAPYQEAWLEFGEDEGGRWIGLSGACHYARAFGDTYRAVPLVKLHENGTVLDVSMTIENRAHFPMDLMYMCHVNFLPAVNGEIIQAAGWDTKDMAVRSSIPAHVKPTKQFLAFLESLSKDPSVTRFIRPEDEYNPEIVFYIRNLRRDAQGLTHMMQKHPEGTSDYVAWDPQVLDHAVRWILVHADQKVMGMALPSTCDPEGYTAEKQKGNVRSIPARGSVTFQVRAGCLDAAETARRISALR